MMLQQELHHPQASALNRMTQRRVSDLFGFMRVDISACVEKKGGLC